MIDVSWPSLVILALTALTIIVTVLIGVRGLHTNLVRSGRLTRKGRTLAIAMCGLGVLTFALGMGDRVITYKKEQQEARERDQQFRQQMGKLEMATNSLTQLQEGMRNSLQRQEQLYGVADQNLRMSGALQQQAQTNTLSVLQRVFAESNRISAERIAVSVSYTCQAEPDDPYPRFPIMREVKLEVEQGGEPRIVLSSTQKVELEGGVIFHGFLGDLGRLETFPAWRNARVRIELTSVPELGTPLDLSRAVRQFEEARRRAGLPPVRMRCPTTVTLLLNGRQVLSSIGSLNQEGDVYFIAEFDNLRVDQNRLPRFAN